MPALVYDSGVYGDTYGEVAAVPPVVVRDRPPLRIHIEIETPTGKTYRWAEDEPNPENVPSGLRWSDTMPGGFESMDCTLPRKPGIDYSDLGQLSTLRVRGASGDIAGEYRLERSPRTSGDQMSISPGAVGWQAHLEDDKSATEVYVDRDLSHWVPLSRTLRISLLGGGWTVYDLSLDPDATAGIPAITLGWDSHDNGRVPISQAWYDSGAANRVSTIYYDMVIAGGTASDARAFVGMQDTDSAIGAGDYTADLLGTSAINYHTPTVSRRYGVLWFDYYPFTTGWTDWGPVYTSWRNIAVYGDTGLSGRGADPVGFYASDIVTHAVGKWAPALNTTSESVQQSGFVIPHMVFLEPTTVGEIVKQATRFGLQDWAVWDNKTFWWHERGAHAKRWRSRVSPAQLDETGPQVERLWESIIVSYQDVDGSTRTVGPPGSGANVIDASLKDDDPDNPANQLGIIRRDVLQMGTSTPAGAIEVGRRFLEESQLLDRSGRARIVGHVEDDHGVLHPYWRPRAGDYIAFTDAADTSYRRIVKTDKDHASRTCGLDLDAPPEGLKALLERLGVVLVPLGLS